MKRHLKKYNKLQDRFSGILYRNPVFTLGLAIPIVIMGTTSLKVAAAFCIAALITIVPVMVFCAVVGKNLPVNISISLSVILAAAILGIALDSIKLISPGIMDSLGIYYSLMAVNTIMLKGAFEAIEHGDAKKSAWDGFRYTLGFCTAMLLLAAVREFLGGGTLWGVPLRQVYVSSIKMPFMGFIILGFSCAFIKFANKLIKKALLKLKPPKKINAKPF